MHAPLTRLHPFLCLLVACLSASCTSGPFVPHCQRETGTLIDVTETVRRNQSRTYSVVSPRASNLHLELSWENFEASLRL